MSSGELSTTAFTADWNSGGTYATAFDQPADKSISATPETPTCIYLSVVSSVFKGATGYVVTLEPKHADGNELKIWLQGVVQSAPKGAQLWTALETGVIKPGTLVFALGGFIRQTANGGRVYHSMPITDPRRVWFVEATEVDGMLQNLTDDE